MSLKDILAGLGTGQIVNIANTLSSIVHAVIEAIDHVRQEHALKLASTLEAVNKLEDRTGQAIAGTTEILTDKLTTVDQEQNNRITALDAKLSSRLNNLDANLTKDMAALEATMKTHVERLEAAIATLAPVGDKPGKLVGYGPPPGE